jgi:hypothetical protein
MKNMSNLQSTFHGLVGIGMVHFMSTVDPTILQNILSLLMQIVIAAGTLWSIFKKPFTSNTPPPSPKV